MFHLFPIEIFPHFTGRLCHFWHIIQRRRRPVGKPVRQKSPLRRLIFLVLVGCPSLHKTQRNSKKVNKFRNYTKTRKTQKNSEKSENLCKHIKLRKNQIYQKK